MRDGAQAVFARANASYRPDFSSGNRHGSQWVHLTMLSSGNRFVQ